MADGYTIAEVDAAITAIVGPLGVRRGDYGWNRTSAMLQAAQRAWIDRYPEDHHTEALRLAIHDLNTLGFMKPKDGVWPDA